MKPPIVPFPPPSASGRESRVSGAAPPHQVHPMLTRQRAAELLGISTRQLDRLCEQGLLEKKYVGNSPRFRYRDILEMMGEEI